MSKKHRRLSRTEITVIARSSDGDMVPQCARLLLSNSNGVLTLGTHQQIKNIGEVSGGARLSESLRLLQSGCNSIIVGRWKQLTALVIRGQRFLVEGSTGNVTMYRGMGNYAGISYLYGRPLKAYYMINNSIDSEGGLPKRH